MGSDRQGDAKGPVGFDTVDVTHAARPGPGEIHRLARFACHLPKKLVATDASGGAVGKITGKEGLSFTGNARVFESEEDCLKGILDGTVVKGDVLVIRYEGPRGAPGMREMLSPTSAIMGKGLGEDIALITDGRFSGGSHGFVVGHVTPEAVEGGPIAVVKTGDRISIDAEANIITLEISDEEMRARLANWKKPAPRYTRGVLAKFAATAASASEGAVTDKYL